ncbi:annexin-like protein RJ4 [Tripterygium wilfordii]|uniref:annexin-like protein RJ4 n=1 Tax=Tripterygium wilfordii TaxID=458696 RepID=UPI0018F817F7|nr:annexin-like protein RJ4 [Tripterygium wilfordii]XP_038717822.1 annexin-like protein RJ4 [Tripterygium wilfordii]XP_038717823.1 annexin-like protein RJ4 [Tripterygium wilfordii]XP_038717824.1 annexin-like protein RJ4 [Tripterygium wilfordii]
MATLIAIDHGNFSPADDAEAIRKACEGWGTDEKNLIKILGHRNASQRHQIRLHYGEIFKEDLIKRFESELSGDLEKAMYRWMLDPADRDAVLANVAFKKGSPEYHVIIEIACVLSPKELFAVRKAYQIRYKNSLEEDLASHTTGDIRKLLVGLVTAYRSTIDEVNARLADNEAEILHNAIKAEEYNHEEVIRILTTRSKAQLMATFNRYRDDHGISISKALSGVKDNDFVKALHTTIRCTNDHQKYYEKVLRNALRRNGTDEDGLTRVIVTKAEKDLKDIKEVYYKRNSVSLDHDVAKETSGDYKAFLLTLLGKED